MNKWIWNLPDWPSFRYDIASLRTLEDQFLHLGGIAVGSIYPLSDEGKTAIKIHLFEEEAVDTSEIEGEILDRASVQSSLRRHLGLTSTNKSRAREAGIAQLMTHLTGSFDQPLNQETLCEWHRLVIADDSKIKEVGHYRTHPAEMQIVSGTIGRQKIHYTAPPSDRVPSEMAQMITWFNDSRAEVPALARAGIAHLWFETIHPFEDGNGRIGRAVSQKALGQAVGSPPIVMLSEIISRDRNPYYDALNDAQSGGNLQIWLNYFAETAIKAQERTIQRIRFVSAKARILDTHAASLNPRQTKAVMRIFEAGPDGFVGGLSAANYRSITKATTPTATRDLNDLVEAGVLYRKGERRYARYYLLV